MGDVSGVVSAVERAMCWIERRWALVSVWAEMAMSYLGCLFGGFGRIGGLP